MKRRTTRYGLPYKGSKNKIADWVCDCLPVSDNFYDLYYGHKIDVKELPDLSDGKPMQYAELIMKHPEVHEEFLREEWMFED